MSRTELLITPAVVGVFIAVVITTTMDATGLTVFSALPLLPLTLVLWYWEKASRTGMGLTLGRARDYGIALLHPIAVLGLVAVAVLAVGTLEPVEDWTNARLNLLAGTPTVVIAVLLTEEGFFRGWLWGSLYRAGRTDHQVLIWSSLAFTLWHVSPVVLNTGFNPPATQVPVYLMNVFVMGTVWGLLRHISGSVLVASVAHGVWNGVAYPLFGFGENNGALGIENTALFGPEVGVLGIALNLLFAGFLWWWWKAGAAPTDRGS